MGSTRLGVQVSTTIVGSETRDDSSIKVQVVIYVHTTFISHLVPWDTFSFELQPIDMQENEA